MTAEQFDRELRYQSAMAAARRMHREGVLTPENLRVIDTMVRAKHSPIFGGLWSKYNLQCPENDAMMVDKEGNYYANYKENRP